MKVLYYDVFCGISGDMNLGALIDLGVSADYLTAELKKLPVDEEYSLKIYKGEKSGITGTKVDVHLHHDHHHHDHDHHHHHHRNYGDIRRMIEASSLSDSVKDLSIKIFHQVAQAEAKVHGKGIDEVHFHEVGATDSIIDIVGAAICIDALEVDKIMASTIHVGSGFVNCAHGRIPVPAPATVEILAGLPMAIGEVKSETTTPTGAAILKATVGAFQDNPNLQIKRIGYGLGTKDFSIPNVLRVYLAEEVNGQETTSEWMIETNLDDMSPEYLAVLEENLFSAGALDVYRTPIVMKKGRLGTKLSVLCQAGVVEVIGSIILKETTAGGLRKYPVQKEMLERSYREIKTSYGPVKMKAFYYQGEKIKEKPEHDEVVALAKEHGVGVNEILKAIDRELCHE